MKLTIGAIKAAEQPLRKVLNADLPVTTAFKLSKLVKVIDNELALYEGQRIKLVERYGEADGDNVSVKPENMPVFMDEINKLLAIEVELPGDPISVDQLGDIKMSAVDLSLLDGFVTASEAGRN